MKPISIFLRNILEACFMVLTPRRGISTKSACTNCKKRSKRIGFTTTFSLVERSLMKNNSVCTFHFRVLRTLTFKTRMSAKPLNYENGFHIHKKKIIFMSLHLASL